MKIELPLNEQTYKQLDNALDSNEICWSELTNEQKIAYGRFGVPKHEYQWNEYLKGGGGTGADILAIHDLLKFYELMEFEGFGSKAELLALELPFHDFKFEVLKKGIEEGRIKLDDFSEELLAMYKLATESPKDWQKLQNEHYQKRRWEGFEDLMKLL